MRWSGRRAHVELTDDLGLEDGLSMDMAHLDVAVLPAKLPRDQGQLSGMVEVTRRLCARPAALSKNV